MTELADAPAIDWGGRYPIAYALKQNKKNFCTIMCDRLFNSLQESLPLLCKLGRCQSLVCRTSFQENLRCPHHRGESYKPVPLLEHSFV